MSKRYPGVRECKNKRRKAYEISFYTGSKRKQIRVEAESMEEASIIRSKCIIEGNYNESGKSNLPFPELKERLRLKCKADGNRPKTVINLMGKFHTLFEEFLPKYYPHIKNIHELKQPILERYKEFIVVDKGRQHGWRDEITKIKSIFQKMAAIGCYDKNACIELLEKFSKPKRRVKVYKEINLEQKRRFLTHIKNDRPDLYGPTFLIIRLGWRREQVISLKRTDIKFDNLRPVEIVCRPENTKNKEPFILRNLWSDIESFLKEAYQASKNANSEWLFPNSKGQKLHSNNYTEYITRKSSEIVGIRLSPHDFRHMFCTQMKKLGMSDRDIMAITGHKDIKSFQIYTHATGEGMKKVLEISKIF